MSTGNAAAEYILRMEHIDKEFPGVKALNDVNFDVRRGEIHALVGENGAGKSTLMNVLCGLIPHGQYEGKILFEGFAQRFTCLRDLVLRHAKLRIAPAVQFRGIPANGVVAVLLDVSDHFPHPIDQIAIVLTGLGSSLL